MKRFYLLALAATLAFTGCKKDDGDPRPENLTIEKTEYALDAVEERTATVAFTAAADWTLSVVYDDAESSADWLSVTPMSGTARPANRPSNCRPPAISGHRTARLMPIWSAGSRACG